MNRRVRRLLIAAAAVAAVVVLLFGAWLVLTRLPYPKTRGRVRLEGVSAPVEILRDRWGVPHIYARTSQDLFFAQGYVHAQDRFWQMEFWRRLGAGRLSELFGKSTLETDKFLRTLGMAEIARQSYEAMDAGSRAALEAYAAGVNAYILNRRPYRLGLEFTLLALQGVKIEIEPWTPVHSLTWGNMMAYDLGSNYTTERSALRMLRSVGRKGWADYYSPYRKDMPFTIDPGELASARAGGAASAPAFVTGSSGIGSNNWVISGRRTASGKPILANDMHLGIQMPSIWYEIGLQGVDENGRVGRTAACPFNVRGYSFPGVPFVIAGHNDRIAWGHTSQYGDVQDLYIERLNPDNPDQYEANGRWVDMAIRYETIKVRKEDDPYVLRVRSTRHGPLLSDRTSWESMAWFAVSPGKNFPESTSFTALALRWTALQPTRLVQSVYHLDQASNFQEFRAAMSQWDIAHQNVVYADVEGNIGYQSTGLQPIRAAGDGTAPVPGWSDEYEWVGFIPFEQMPYLYNPERGYIATANNPVVGPEYEHFLGTEFDMGYRARRIREMIEAHSDGITIEDVERMQGDVYDQAAAENVAYLRGLDLAAAATPPPPEKEKPADESRRAERRRRKEEQKAQKELAAMEAARERLLAWDNRMERDSAEAALYACFFLKLIEETFKDQYPESAWPPSPSARIESTIYTLLQDPGNAWWDDVGTPEVREKRDDILARAFVKGYRYAVKHVGKSMDKWRWGKVHTAEFRNATLGESGIGPIEKIFNRGPVEVQGGSTQVDAGAWSMEKPFAIRHTVSQRLIVDLGDLGRSLSVHTTGQSGHPTNRHYDDFIEPWRNVEYHPTLWEREAVEKASRARLRLLPLR
jgi:penicillin amidase